QIITPNGTAKMRSIAAITAILGLRRTHFLPRVTSQCAGRGSAHALASVQDLRRAQGPKNNGAADLYRGTSGKSLQDRDLFSGLTGTVAAARYPRAAGPFHRSCRQQKEDGQ